MNPAVLARFAHNYGLITRVDALDLDVSPSTIRMLLRDDDWIWMRRGVYADAEVWNAADVHRGQPLLRARAATLMMRRGWVLSHDSAAHALGMDIVIPGKPFVHVTRPGFTNAWTKAGVKHHLARFRPEQVVVVDGLRVLDPARTAVDIAREHQMPYGVVATDSALRMGVSREDLETAAAVMVSWPYVTHVRNAIDLAHPGAQSGAESLGRMMVLELGIGDVDPQFPVQLGNRIYWADIRVGCHLFEVHGKQKYIPVEDGGLAEKPVVEVMFSERKRESLLVSEHLGLSNLYYADLWREHRVEAKKRLMADWQNTVARFGTELPEHLLRNAERIRARFDAPGAHAG